MLQSKALKENADSKEPSRLYLWWLDTAISEYYYSFVHKFVTNPIFQVKRLIQWYWNVFRFDYDFDGHCMFAIIEYKLKRIQHVLYNGHAIHEDKDLKALKVAIKLAARLKDDNYEIVAFDRFEKKWGKLRSWNTPSKDRKDLLQCHFKYENVNTPEDEAKCYGDRRIQYQMTYNRYKREEKWLYAILHKYLRNWWD